MCVIRLLLLCFLIFVASANAKEQRFPPYPNIWGYDLMEDFNQEISLGLDVDHMNNGDYLLQYPSIKTHGNNKPNYTLLFFFEQRKKVFKSIDNAIKYSHSLDFKYEPEIAPYIILNDKKIIDIHINSDVHIKHHRINSIHDTYIQRIDEFGDNKPSDDKTSLIGIATYCNSEQICTNLAYSLAKRIIKLEDDTFLIFNPNHYLLLRFDRKFKTKFKPKHTVRLDANRVLKSNFYIIPYSKVEHFFDNVAKGYIGEYTNEINQQFLDYLYEEEKNGKT